MKSTTQAMALAVLLTIGTTGPVSHAESSTDLGLQLLKRADGQWNAGDWRIDAVVAEREHLKVKASYGVTCFRRPEERKVMVLAKQHASAGQTYLRHGKNVWFFDPGSTKWDRQTVRDATVATQFLALDFGESNLAETYQHRDEGTEMVGKFATTKLLLNARPGVGAAFPMVRVWIDQATSNILKREDYGAEGGLVRTSYYLGWAATPGRLPNAGSWYPQEIHHYDDVDKSRSTVVLLRNVDGRQLDDNLFTKGWVQMNTR